MTLDDLERKNRVFYGFFRDFGLQHTFQKQQHSCEMVAPSGNASYPMSVAGSMSLDLFAVGLQTCTAVARSPLR